MMEVCNDNRFELIEKYKNELLESTNIADSKEEMDVIDSILFRFWQMGWLDGLESVNRLLNDCNTYKIRWAKASRTARAEAIKEFAKLLKERKYLSSDWSHGEHPYVVEEDDINNLVEEMTGDQNNDR